MEYRFERISEKSYPDLATLYGRCFGIRIAIPELKRKYDTARFGASHIGFIAYAEDGSPAAYYSVFPISVMHGTKKILAAQSGDTMTDPDHQKKGLFTRLAKMSYSLAQEEGVQFIFGFPNENSFPGFQSKLNWVFHDKMQIGVLKGSPIPLCELSTKVRSLRPLYAWMVESALNKFRNNWQSIPLQSGLQVLKDAHFFDYKSGANRCKISIDGFNLFVQISDHVYLGDVDYFDEDGTGRFRNTLKRLGRICYSGKVILTVSKNHWLYARCKSFVDFNDSLPIGFLDLSSGLDFCEFQFTRADYDTF